MRVIAVCQLKSGGSSTLALTVASVAAAEGRDVVIVDAARNGDLARWATLPRRPVDITVVPCRSAADIDRAIRQEKGRRSLVVVDAGTKRERLRVAAHVADIALIPVRFSPLSAYWASETDRLIRRGAAAGKRRGPIFVATAIAQIPSRVARSVELGLALSDAARLPSGLALRAAFEAPFLFGGTIFTLPDAAAPGLDRARTDARALAGHLAALVAPPPVRRACEEPEGDWVPWRGLALSEFRHRETASLVQARSLAFA